MRNFSGKQVANEQQSKMEHEPHATNVFVSTYNNYSSIKRVTRKFHVVVVQQETAKKCTI